MSHVIHDIEPQYTEKFDMVPMTGIEKLAYQMSGIPLDLIEFPDNFRELTDGELIRSEIRNLKTTGKVSAPIEAYKTTNSQKPFRFLRGANRIQACLSRRTGKIQATFD